MEMPSIKVADFEGPFDLLLHLIKKHEMDIYNIEIYKITNQYLRYLDEMKEMDLDITSEFIVVAATLIEIKSKKLLPKVVVQEENEEDIEKNLMIKLIEYKKFKNVSEFFKERYISSGDVYTKMPELIEEKKEQVKTEDLLKNVTLLDLYKLYNDLLETYRLKRNNESVIQKRIFVDKYKLEDKIQYVLEKLQNIKVIEFNEFIAEGECKMEAVVTFVALLELIKLRMVKVYQDNSFDNILIKRRHNE